MLSHLLLAFTLLATATADEHLLHSVKNGELEQVRQHLKELGKNPNHKDPWEKSVLMHSAYKGHFDIAVLLLEHGADVNSISNSGRTPLIAAAFGGHVKLVKLFIKHGANLDVQDKRHQMTALHHGINEIRHDHDAEHEACIRALIDAGADMHLVAKNGKTVEHIADMKKLYHFDLHKHIVHHKSKTKPKNADDGPTDL
jgi:ankyrin repeat protein